jgi:hypothetical protein
LPFLLPAAFALLVAAFSAGLNAAHAAAGKYLYLPLDGLPSEVFHFCAVHFLRDF